LHGDSFEAAVFHSVLCSTSRYREQAQACSRVANHAGAERSEVVDLVVALFLLAPESEVLLEQLDDALGVAELVLLEFIDLVESTLEGRVGNLASLRVLLHHLVVEHGEVKGETELDRVAGGELDRGSPLVGLLGALLGGLESGVLGILADVAVVIAHHLNEESLGLVRAFSTVWTEGVRVDDGDDALAVGVQLLLNLTLVGDQSVVELLVLWVLLDGRDRAAGSSLGRNQILESHGEEVALVGVHTRALRLQHLLEVANHIVEALGLLSNARKEDVLLVVS